MDSSTESSGGACARSGDIPVADLIARSAILPMRHYNKVRRFALAWTATGMSPLLGKSAFHFTNLHGVTA